PEQTIGDPVDPRADLYSATAMLFEMLTGRPPFASADKLELLAMQATRPPPTLAERRPELAAVPDLEALVATGLAKRPAERHASAGPSLAATAALSRHSLPGAPDTTPGSAARPIPPTRSTGDDSTVLLAPRSPTGGEAPAPPRPDTPWPPPTPLTGNLSLRAK